MASIDDLLFSLGEWIHTTPLVDFAIWISHLKVSETIGSHFLAIPLLQTVHIVAIATAFGAVLMLNLRVLGLVGREKTIVETGERYRPWIWGALLVLILSGSGLIVAEPIRELMNPIFWIKMALLIALILLSIGFQAALRGASTRWDVDAGGGAAVRIGAAGLILVWCIVMIAGRWIAYAPA